MAKIEPKENGPLLVTGVPKLRGYGDGEAVEPPREVFALCRCGHSSNKPFCDGTHSKQGWESVNEGDIRNKSLTYEADIEGHHVEIAYTPVLCGHVAECVTRLPAVFDPKAKPWCQPENGSVDAIKEVVQACPSGALRISIDGEDLHHIETGVEDAVIEIKENGPYVVHNLEIDAEFNGVGADEQEFILCRCGHSKNKPFCDGTHQDVKWKGKIKDG